MTVSLSAPGKLEHAFLDAGFLKSSVSVTPQSVPREFASVADAIDAMRSTSPAQGELAQTMSEAERTLLLDQARAAAAAVCRVRRHLPAARRGAARNWHEVTHFVMLP